MVCKRRGLRHSNPTNEVYGEDRREIMVKCFYCKKQLKDLNSATWGRKSVKGKYVTKSPHYFHTDCWKKYSAGSS